MSITALIIEGLTQLQQDLIVGTLLGDGSFQTGSHGLRWRYRAYHALAVKPYCETKYVILAPFCSSPLAERDYFDSRTQKTYYSVFFNTKQSDLFSPLALKFYTYNEVSGQWVKDVPMDISTLLTARALAYLYQDDGSVKWRGHSKAVRICTESFTKEGVERLRDAIQLLFKIETRLVNQYRIRGGVKTLMGYRLYIPESSAQAFCNLIREYVVPSMEFKLTC